jgi:hypothetical protein
LRLITSILLSLSLSSCCWFGECEDTPTDPEVQLPEFTNSPKVSNLNVDDLDEVSGMGASYLFPGHLWLMEDSGTEPKIDLIRQDGTYARKVTFGGRNRDWEDMAVAPGPVDGKKYIYIGETGDNNAIYKDYYIYRFEEPSGTHVSQYETIHFRYPNGESYDAETIMVDPWTKDIFVITKNQLNVRVYRLAYPQNTNGLNEAEFLGTIKYFLVVSGDVSEDGTEVLLKSYSTLYYWKRKEGETLMDVLKRSHDMTVPYVLEPQGESVCWSANADGYYTISEKGENMTKNPPLYFYMRK